MVMAIPISSLITEIRSTSVPNSCSKDMIYTHKMRRLIGVDAKIWTVAWDRMCLFWTSDNLQRRDLKSTGVVPAKHPLTIKSKPLHVHTKYGVCVFTYLVPRWWDAFIGSLVVEKGFRA